MQECKLLRGIKEVYGLYSTHIKAFRNVLGFQGEII